MKPSSHDHGQSTPDTAWDRQAIVGQCRSTIDEWRRQLQPAASWLHRHASRAIAWLNQHHRDLLRYSLAIVFIWFGGLKPLGISPANVLVERTVPWFSPDWFIPFLGLVEVAIGLGLMIRRFNAAALVLLFLQMAGTLLPLFTLIDVCYTQFPFGLTLEGQYIIKNLVLISAAISIALASNPYETAGDASFRVVAEPWREGLRREA